MANTLNNPRMHINPERYANYCGPPEHDPQCTALVVCHAGFSFAHAMFTMTESNSSSVRHTGSHFVHRLRLVHAQMAPASRRVCQQSAIRTGCESARSSARIGGWPGKTRGKAEGRSASQQFWVGKGEYQHVPVRDIAAAWRCSSSGLAVAAALAAPLRPSREGDAALAWAPYALQGA